MVKDSIINTLCTIPMTLVMAYGITFLVHFKRKWIYILLYGVGAPILRILMTVTNLNAANDIIQFVLVPALVVIASDDKLSRKLFASLMAYAIMFMIEPLGNLFFTALGGTIDETASSNLLANPGVYILVRLVLLFLTGIVTFVIVFVWNKCLKKAGKWDLLTFTLFPLSQMLLCWYATAMVTRAGGAEHDYMVISILLLVSIAADVVMVFAINRLRAADEAKQRNDYLEQQLSQQQNYYDRVKKDAEDTSRVRHDLRNQIQTAYALMDEGNDASARKIFDGLSDRISSVQYYCDNPVVNAVMNEKASACSQSGIRLTSRLGVKYGSSVDEMDMCSLFANVMDNAINGCRASGADEPVIDISAEEKAGYMVLVCRNSAAPAENADSNSKKHNRSPLSEHGWGLEILSNITEKYDGHLETQQTDGEFETKAFIKV